MVQLKPRAYQEEVLTGIDSLLASGTNRPAVVMATGLGKTVVFSHWIHRRVMSRPRERVVVWVHRDELAKQARDKIHSIAPHLRPGIVMANQRDHDRQVIVASIQTVSRAPYRRRDAIHGVGAMVADECHHAAAPTWRSTLEHFGAWAGVPTVGFTATMSREDGRGLGEIWEKVVERPDGGNWDTLWGVRNGFLADVRGIRVKVPRLDLSGVHIRGGDLQQDETAEAMLDANTGAAIVKAIHEFAPARRGVVFAPNVATAEQFAADMNEAGIRTETIIGTTPVHERQAVYARFRTGETRWLTNAMVLTEGWDAPWADCAVIARPTKSSALYQQMVGRVLRPWPAGGKQDALILDVVGATELHGLASLTDLSEDRQVKPRENQSLLEAWDEFEDSPELDTWQDAPAPVHSVVGTEIDMFGQSHSVWLQTAAKGIWFIPAGDMLFFLWPQAEGLYGLYAVSKQREMDAVLLQSGLHMEIGMALAEAEATEYAPEHVGKAAAWRQNGPVTKGQKAELARWGVTTGLTKMSSSDAYDKINVLIASRRLDR